MGTFADSGDFAALLRGIVFVGTTALGSVKSRFSRAWKVKLIFL